MLVSVSETTGAPPLGLELACLSRDSPVTIYRPRYGHGRKCGFAAVNNDKNLSVLSVVKGISFVIRIQRYQSILPS
jgi:hypothetical protein